MEFIIPEEYKNNSGIYLITNSIDSRVYVGSAKNLLGRYRQHQNHLLQSKHHCRKLQRFSDKYGAFCLTFALLELCSIEDLIEKEQKWIDHYDAYHIGFNTSPKAASNIGFKMTPEQREKVAASQLGRKQTAETIQKRVATIQSKPNGYRWNAGKTLPEETKRKIGEAQKGRKCKHLDRFHSPEARAKAAAKTRGQKRSEEARANYRAAARRRAPYCKPNPIEKYDLNGNYLITFPTLYDATKDLFFHVGRTSIEEDKKYFETVKKMIISVYKGEHRQVHGFIYRKAP